MADDETRIDPLQKPSSASTNIGHGGSWAATLLNWAMQPIRIVRDSNATPVARIGTALCLLVVAIAFIKSGLLEAPFNEIAAINANAVKAKTDACTARSAALMSAPPDKIQEMAVQIAKDCGPQYSNQTASMDFLFDDAGTGNFMDTIKKVQFIGDIRDKIINDVNNEQYQDAMQLAIGLYQMAQHHHGSFHDFAVKAVAYAALFNNNPKLSLDSANVLLAIHPDDIEAQVDKAHALMFMGKNDDANAIYQSVRNTPLAQGATADIFALLHTDNGTWGDVIHAQFTQFREAGKTSPVMDQFDAPPAPPSDAATYSTATPDASNQTNSSF